MACLLGAARAVAHVAIEDRGYPTTDYHRRRLSYFNTVVCRPSGRHEPTRAQLVEALRYKPEGRGFDSRLCHWNFSLTKSFRPHCGYRVDSASNRNEYQEYFMGVKVADA